MTVLPITPELEVVDGEVVEPLDKVKAEKLDKRIRRLAQASAEHMDQLAALVEEAKAAAIHVALGFPSWPAYLMDAVQIAPTDKAERKMLATLMYSEGLSQRAIAAVLDVDQKTVSNDLRSGEENSSTATAGVDGKSYKRKPKGAAPQPKVPQPLNIVVSDVVAALNNAVDGITSIADDDRFTANRDKFVSHRPDLQRAIETLQKVVDKLDGDDTAEAQS